jgi:lycopene cyclase domain-containing protein
MEYLIILLVVLAITILLERISRVSLFHSWKERLLITGLFFVVGVVWDSFAIWQGHWIFPQGNNLGIVIGLMPLEEYFFMLIVPYFIITIYKVVDSRFNGRD